VCRYVRKASDAGPDDQKRDMEREKPTSSRYHTTLAPLTPEMIVVSRDDDNALPGNQLPLNPPGVTPVSFFY